MAAESSRLSLRIHVCTPSSIAAAIGVSFSVRLKSMLPKKALVTGSKLNDLMIECCSTQKISMVMRN
jgi:hypothetical protein